MSLISGRFHRLASYRPTLPRPQPSRPHTCFAVWPEACRSSVSLRARRRLAAVAPYASSLIWCPLTCRLLVWGCTTCESQTCYPLLEWQKRLMVALLRFFTVSRSSADPCSSRRQIELAV